MAINLINPNYNLINTTQSAGTAGRGSLPNGTGSPADSVQSFSDILETVVTNMNQQNQAVSGNLVTIPQEVRSTSTKSFKKLPILIKCPLNC
jgi:hypothetical protein